MTGIRSAVAAAVLLAVLSAPAATPRLGREEFVPGSGVRIRMFRGMEQSPLQPPRAGVRRSDQAHVVAVGEQWIYSQCLGNWKGPGLTAMLGEVKFAPPPPLQFATPEELETAFVPLAADSEPDAAALLKWINAFCPEGKFTGLEPAFSGNNSKVRRFRPGAPDAPEAYLITRDGIRRRRVVVVYRFEAPSREREAWAKLCRRSAAAAGFWEVASKTEPSGGSVRRSAARQAGVERAIAGIRGLKGWWYRETPNYVFISNQRDRRDLRLVQRDLERARQIYLRYYRSDAAVTMIGVVRIFETREEYLRYVDPGMEWSGGYWSPSRLELVVSPLPRNVPDSVQDKVLRSTAFHEGFHQFLHYAAGMAESGMWFNEGNAEFFEHLSLRGGSFTVSVTDEEVEEIRRLLRSDFDLEAFMKLDREAFYETSGRNRNYKLAFALLYYLLKGAPAENQRTYAAIPFVYFRELAATRNDAAARRAALSGVDAAAFNAAFRSFWNDRGRLRKAGRYNGIFSL